MTWPAPGLADMQGGMERVRMPIGALNHFTATCGPDIFRGDRLPADLRGDLLFAEPVGRLIRRAKVVVTEGLTQLRNAYPNSEFILSTDPLFRPVNMMTAPDGTLYIVDMYHGIIQESEWTPRGSYLRKKIEQLQLDKITGHGRIWRLVYDGIEPNRPQPRMLDETPGPARGASRASERLVARHGAEAARAAAGPVGRAGAAGDGAQFLQRARTLPRDVDARRPRRARRDARARSAEAIPTRSMRVQAIRASESLYKAGDTSFDADFRQLTKDPDTRVDMQAMLTLNLWKVPDISTVVQAAQAANKARGVQEVGRSILQPAGARVRRRRRRRPDRRGQLALLQQGEGIYAELCVTCHGPDGKGAPVDLAPAGTMKAPPLAGLAARAGPSRLRDQGGAARADGTGRRQHLHGRHGADGIEQR